MQDVLRNWTPREKYVKDSPGEASHCNTFAILLSQVFSSSLPKDIFLLLIFHKSSREELPRGNFVKYVM